MTPEGTPPTNQAGDMKEERMPSPFEQVVEAAQAATRPQADRGAVEAMIEAALSTGLLKLVEERPEDRIATALKMLREAGKELLSKPTDEQAHRALEVARDRGWLIDDGFVWDRQDSGHHPEGEPSPKIALRNDSRGELDDVVVEPVTMFRAEIMGDDLLWLACYLPSGERITWNVHGKEISFAVGEMPNEYEDWDAIDHPQDR